MASTRLYGGSITQLGKTIKKFGWQCTFVDVDDHEATCPSTFGKGVVFKVDKHDRFLVDRYDCFTPSAEER